MIGIADLYDRFKSAVNEHHGGGVPISTFVNWAHEVQLQIFNSLLEDFQKSQTISDYLTPFLDTANVIVSKNQGAIYDVAKLPVGYENLAAARIITKNGKFCGCSNKPEFKDGESVSNSCEQYIDEDELKQRRLDGLSDMCEVEVSIIDNDRWGNICNHPRKKVKASSPAMTQFSGGFKIIPKNVTSTIIMDFFRLPNKPVFSFTVINPNTESEYIQANATGSEDLEWSEKLIPNFLGILSAKYSIFVGK